MAAGATAPLFQPRCLERGRNRTFQAHLAPGPALKAGLLGSGFGCRWVDGGCHLGCALGQRTLDTDTQRQRWGDLVGKPSFSLDPDHEARVGGLEGVGLG